MNHNWESEWNDDGQFICKTCKLSPNKCEGKVIIGRLKNG